jgi:tRNA (guanine-N7-)-methyltransferase
MRRAKRLPLEELAPYLWEAPRVRPGEPLPAATPIDWTHVFGNDHPVEIEVGFGKGLFLLNAAVACPDVNFFGVEIMRKYQLFTATRMARRKLTNVRLACGDARHLLRDYVRPASVRAIHVYFPDPWWKKRHHKRRVFTEDFVASCVQALAPSGLFHLATDVAEYFAVMNELCVARAELEPLPPPTVGDQDYLTNFERKAKAKGTPVHRALYRKR